MKPSSVLALGLACALGGVVRAADPPTYHADVAPILQEHCQGCHRPGAIGPFPLQDYSDAASDAEMIAEVVRDARMPPWGADPEVGHFANDISLPAAKRETLLAWVAAGCPEGDAAQGPSPRRWPDPQAWRIGKPDAVLSLPRPMPVPATGVVDYQYVDVPTGFTEDKWVTAIEVRPGARAVVHHVLVFAVYADRRASPRVRGGLNGFFAAAVPGNEVLRFPAGAARFLPAGTTLRFQLHYTPNGEAQEDQTQVGLTFATGPVERRAYNRGLFNTRFAIPPGAADHVVRAKHVFGEDAVLVALMPHMHLRGKSFRFLLRYPDGSSQALLNVPRWDFNWQSSYVLEEPLFVPRGSRLIGVASFDNSEGNPANPDPSQLVRFGEQTFDEMMIGYFELLEPREEDRKAWKAKQGAPQK